MHKSCFCGALPHRTNYSVYIFLTRTDPGSIRRASVVAGIQLQAGCDKSTTKISNAVEANMNQNLPCVPTCQASVSAVCVPVSGGRKRRSTGTMTTTLTLTMDFGPSTHIDPSRSYLWLLIKHCLSFG